MQIRALEDELNFLSPAAERFVNLLERRYAGCIPPMEADAASRGGRKRG